MCEKQKTKTVFQIIIHSRSLRLYAFAQTHTKRSNRIEMIESNFYRKINET